MRERSVRPTAARVREAVFNILSFHIQDAVVLDLFAGTGALGLEAMSRGAAYAVFIDHNKKILSQISQSIRQLDLDKQTKLIRWDITKNLNCITKLLPISRDFHSSGNSGFHSMGFNLVFIDPPYYQGLIKATLCHLNTSGALKRGAIIVIEHAASESIPKDLMAYEITDQRKYGQTLVSFLDYFRGYRSD